jgi:hypothetical protein
LVYYKGLGEWRELHGLNFTGGTSQAELHGLNFTDQWIEAVARCSENYNLGM